MIIGFTIRPNIYEISFKFDLYKIINSEFQIKV